MEKKNSCISISCLTSAAKESDTEFGCTLPLGAAVHTFLSEQLCCISVQKIFVFQQQLGITGTGPW